MKKLVMGIGVPGSGKTTMLKALAEENGYGYVCPDEIREELSGAAADQTRNREVWELAHERMATLLNEKQAVIFDATFANERDRLTTISIARAAGAGRVEGVYFDVPLEIAQERNAARERKVPDYAIERMHTSLKEHSPAVIDGFDSLYTYDEFAELTKAEHVRGHVEYRMERFK